MAIVYIDRYRVRKKVKTRLLCDILLVFFLCKVTLVMYFFSWEKIIMGGIVHFFYNKDIKIRIYDVV